MSLDLFSKKYVVTEIDSFTIGEFPSERLARAFLTDLTKDNLQNLWFVLAKALQDTLTGYFLHPKLKLFTLDDAKKLVCSMNLVDKLYTTREDNFTYTDSVLKKRTKFYIRIKQNERPKRKPHSRNKQDSQ